MNHNQPYWKLDIDLLKLKYSTVLITTFIFSFICFSLSSRSESSVSNFGDLSLDHFNPLSANPTSFLSVFHQFVGLVLKRLILLLRKNYSEDNFSLSFDKYENMKVKSYSQITCEKCSYIIFNYILR